MFSDCGGSGFNLLFCLRYLVLNIVANLSSGHEAIKTGAFKFFKTHDKFCSMVSPLGQVYSGDFFSQKTVMISLRWNNTTFSINFVHN
jgi:hypothetical protein